MKETSRISTLMFWLGVICIPDAILAFVIGESNIDLIVEFSVSLYIIQNSYEKARLKDNIKTFLNNKEWYLSMVLAILSLISGFVLIVNIYKFKICNAEIIFNLLLSIMVFTSSLPKLKTKEN